MSKTTEWMVLALAMGASGCGNAEFVRKPTAPGQAVIYVYRPAKWVGAIVNGGVALDGPGGFRRTFPLRNNKYVATIVPAGNYNLTVVGAFGKVIANAMPIGAAEGSASFVRCSFFDGCAQLPEAQGAPEAADCKENVAGD